MAAHYSPKGENTKLVKDIAANTYQTWNWVTPNAQDNLM